MHLLQINNTFYPVPTTWNELTGDQLIQAVHVLQSNTEMEPGRVQLYKILTRIPWIKLWLSGPGTNDDKMHITDFILKGNTLTKNVLPVYKKRYGPRDNFSNLIACEFIATDSFYLAYFNAKDSGAPFTDYLDQLVAILYRPGKPGYNAAHDLDGDIRIPFNDNVIKHDCTIIKTWPLKVKQAIAHWYAGCRGNLGLEFPEIFSGATSGGEPPKYGLWDMVYNVAETSIFGSFENVEKQYLKTLLMAVTKTILEAEKLKKLSTVK